MLQYDGVVEGRKWSFSTDTELCVILAFQDMAVFLFFSVVESLEVCASCFEQVSAHVVIHGNNSWTNENIAWTNGNDPRTNAEMIKLNQCFSHPWIYWA